LSHKFLRWICYLFFHWILANDSGQPIEEVAKAGTTLAFVVYPSAVDKLPVSPLWSILFFGMLITLGLDSEFALVETVTTCISDKFPVLRKKKALVIILYGCFMFLLGLPYCTSAGPLFLDFIDTSASSWNICIIAFMECICISYVYGIFRFKEDIRLMIGSTGCGIPWNICFLWWGFNWAFLTPLGVLFVMIFYWIDPSEITPTWADNLGLCISLLVVICIVIVPLVHFLRASGSFFERLTAITKPSEYWGPALVKHRKLVEHIPDFVIDPYEGTTTAVLTNEIKITSVYPKIGLYNDGYNP